MSHMQAMHRRVEICQSLNRFIGQSGQENPYKEISKETELTLNLELKNIGKNSPLFNLVLMTNCINSEISDQSYSFQPPAETKTRVYVGIYFHY